MSPERQDEMAVSAEGISKRFRLHPRPSLRGRPRSAWRTLQGPAVGAAVLVDEDEDDETTETRDEQDEEPRAESSVLREIWALRDVSFTTVAGSIMGVAGPPGAGKTTLLRVLGRTTPPTAGRATIAGRVSPPVETALRFFEPERTGRRNVLDIAEIFGVPSAVAHRQLDEIFRFAALETLVDVELMRYSTGYLRRLAFSAVVNLEPSVLLADGLPGMGDPEFRERSLERITERRSAGMTVILATTDQKLLRRVCDSAIWLDEGRVIAAGSGEEVADLAAQSARGVKRALMGIDVRQGPGEPAIRSDGEAVPEAAESAPVQRSTDEDKPESNQGGPLAGARKRPEHTASSDQLVIADAGAYSLHGERVLRIGAKDEALLRILLQVRRAPVELRCKVALRRGGTRHLRLLQASAIRIDTPGAYEASVPLPPGSLATGAYTASVGAEIASGGQRTEALLRRAFHLKATGPGRRASPARQSERSDLPWNITAAPARELDRDP